ncbi:hypothetical protein [Maricaulis sp.]|uniref:hypothetical protein n=1 Tax=Maricaulis sp. TaxID=1486257 RepID=UPI00261EA8E7|nr:hypothetical protein [Maricaulis sp.]
MVAPISSASAQPRVEQTGAVEAPAPAPSAIELAYADAQLADGLITSITGGAQGLPAIDGLTVAAIGAAIAQDDYAAAYGHAQNFVIGKGVSVVLGSAASGFVAAVSTGEALGIRAAEHYGGGRLNALYANLSRDTNAAAWPDDYAAAMADDFLGPRFNARILPVVNWLRQTSGQTGTDQEFAAMAYDMMRARRDFELGCDRYGLTGAERTAERLAQAEADHVERLMRDLAIKREVDLYQNQLAREALEAREAQRAAERAEYLRQQAADLAEYQQRQREAEAERAAAEAAAALARAEAARERLQDMYAERALQPPVIADTALGINVLEVTTESQTTLYRLQVRNTSATPITGFRADARMRTPSADAGIVLSGSSGLRTLEPGETIELSFLGDGALDGVMLYLSGAGQVLSVLDYPMHHEAEVPTLTHALGPRQPGFLILPMPTGVAGMSADALAADGQIIFGSLSSGPNEETAPYVWREGVGHQALEMPDGYNYSHIRDATPAGDYAVGNVYALTPDGNLVGFPVRWTLQGEPQALLPARSAIEQDAAAAVSADGELIAGTRLAGDGRVRPFLWRANEGVVDLPLPAGIEINAFGALAGIDGIRAMSGDGRVIVGHGTAAGEGAHDARQRALVWRDGAFIGAALPSGYVGAQITAVSANGRFMAGVAVRPITSESGTYHHNDGMIWEVGGVARPVTEFAETAALTITAISDDGEWIAGHFGDVPNYGFRGLGFRWSARAGLEVRPEFEVISDMSDDGRAFIGHGGGGPHSPPDLYDGVQRALRHVDED